MSKLIVHCFSVKPNIVKYVGQEINIIFIWNRFLSWLIFRYLQVWQTWMLPPKFPFHRLPYCVTGKKMPLHPEYIYVSSLPPSSTLWIFEPCLNFFWTFEPFLNFFLKTPPVSPNVTLVLFITHLICIVTKNLLWM